MKSAAFLKTQDHQDAIFWHCLVSSPTRTDNGQKYEFAFKQNLGQKKFQNHKIFIIPTEQGTALQEDMQL